MKRIVLDVRFYITVTILFLLLLCQFLTRTTIFWGRCNPSLSDPTGPVPTDSYLLDLGTTVVGWPFNFVAVSVEGCFNDRKTQTEWNIPFFLIDILLIGSIGALPYGIPWLWQRLGHQKTQ